METILGDDTFVIEDLKIMFGIIGVLEERMGSKCYQQDFQLTETLKTTITNLNNAKDMILMRLLGDQHE